MKALDKQELLEDLEEVVLEEVHQADLQDHNPHLLDQVMQIEVLQVAHNLEAAVAEVLEVQQLLNQEEMVVLLMLLVQLARQVLQHTLEAEAEDNITELQVQADLVAEELETVKLELRV